MKPTISYEDQLEWVRRKINLSSIEFIRLLLNKDQYNATRVDRELNILEAIKELITKERNREK